jgi:hypothetical protein
MEPASPTPPPATGSAAVADALTRSGAFVECVFHCAVCGTAGTSLIRPPAVPGRRCTACGAPVVVTVLERFGRRA